MARRGKYDLIIKSKENDEIQYVLKDYDLNNIDAFCSAYNSELECLAKINEERTIIPNSHLNIVDYKGFKYQPIFGNNILRCASINTYKGKDSYGKERLKIQKSDEIGDVVIKFIDILTTEEGKDFSKTTMGKTCVVKNILNLAIRYGNLKRKNKEGRIESIEEIQEMNEIANNLIKDIYVYKNLRGIIVFIERFKSRKKYNFSNQNKKNNKNESVQFIKKEYVLEKKMSSTEEFTRYCEDTTGKEEFLDEFEIEECYQDEGFILNKKL